MRESAVAEVLKFLSPPAFHPSTPALSGVRTRNLPIMAAQRVPFGMFYIEVTAGHLPCRRSSNCLVDTGPVPRAHSDFFPCRRHDERLLAATVRCRVLAAS